MNAADGIHARCFSVSADRNETNARAEWSVAALSGRFVELSGGPAAATLTAAFQLVAEMQRRDEPVAWITERTSVFYPPDAAEAGVDLSALVVIALPSLKSGSSGARQAVRRGTGRRLFTRGRSSRARSGAPRTGARAADLLLRSGGFGLVVLDLMSCSRRAAADVPLAMQTRLAGLARKHGSVFLCLTEKNSETSSLGSLVSLRAEAVRVIETDRSDPGSLSIEGPSTEGLSTDPLLAGGTLFSARERKYSCEVRALKDKCLGSTWQHREACRAPLGMC